MHDYWLSKAIRICGSQNELARRMRVKPEKISYILNRAKKISLEDALLIDEATNNAVTCFHLMEYLDPKIRKKLEAKLNKIDELRISERIALAMACEKEWSKRRGRPKADIRRKLDEFKGRTDEMIAKKYGFHSKDKYRQAKQVIQHGTSELIQAMDSEYIPISLAAKLAKLPENKQQRMLQYSKKDIIAQLKQMHKSDIDPLLALTMPDLNAFLYDFMQLYFSLRQYIKKRDELI